MLAYLKIKIVSLAAEAVLIRKDERKWKAQSRHPKNNNPRARDVFLGLKDHRKGIVRNEARWALIAYGFLKGLRYEQIERPVRKPVNERRVVELVCKYAKDTPRLSNHSEPEIRNLVKAWLAA